MNLRKFENKNIHIVGVSGAEGSAVAEFFAQNLKNKKLFAHDFCEEKDFEKNFLDFHDGLKKNEKAELYEKIMKLKIKFNFGVDYLKDIEKADVIVVPQSWYRYKQNDALHRYQNKVSFYNITKLYFELCPCKIIGITGTSGKSTTSNLIYEILKSTNNKVYFTGNDRKNVQILDQIDQMDKNDLMVIEISNRQLKLDLKRSPHIAVITNITPSHLDDHKDYEEYLNTKKSILSHQNKDDYAVLNYDYEVTRDFGRDAKATVSYFSAKMPQENGAYVENGDIMIKIDEREYRICAVQDIMLKGPHNVENVLAAATATYLAGAGTKEIREVVTRFKGLESRLELVKEIKGVEYYEDSQSCNPEGTRFAVQSFMQPIILIAGGTRKTDINGEFDNLANDIVKNNVKALFLIGVKALEIEKSVRDAVEKLNKKGLLILKYDSLDDAVSQAYRVAKKGDVVVMSPGCESFDMFKDYRDRGKQFKKLVRKLERK